MAATPLFRYTFDTAFFAGIGYLYSQQARISSPLTVLIAITSRVANSILFEAVKRLSRDHDDRLYNYAATNFIVNMLTIVALRHFELIAKTGSIALTGLALLNTACLYLSASGGFPLADIYLEVED
jgi:hypothetical protein